MKRSLVLLALLCTVPAWAHQGGSRGDESRFFFKEESERLPPDTSLPGTSSTDVDLSLIHI